jgi:hypothetical protein
MHTENKSQALASPDQVRELALLFIRISEAVHHALRELSSSKSQNAASAYALLTEEYALRGRANMLMIEAGRFARHGLDTTQREMVDTLEAIHQKLKSGCASDELAELIIGVVLFANSVASTKNHVVSFLLVDLQKTLEGICSAK